MCADFLPVQGEERTWLGLIGKDALYGLCISSVGHKANVLAFSFVGVDKAIFLCNGAHLVLMQLTQGEQGVGQLLLG